MNATEIQIHKVLKTIKSNDGFPGPVPAKIQERIVPEYAYFDISPFTGLITQWHLTTVGKKKLRELNAIERFRKKNKDSLNKRPSRYTPEAPVPLTIEVLDALKAIKTTGHPQTDKMEILARIQRRGGGGPYAEYMNERWCLTQQGLYQAANHIRKSECAQFSGKVR
jgi:hypothetical protein